MEWLDRLVGRSSSTSGTGAIAKERLKIVVEYDRAQLSAAKMELIRDDIVRSISRHVEVSQDEVEVKLEPGGRLVAEIPLSRRSPHSDGHER